jgi:diguanylate cyclase (GGDEF)-like protein
VYDQKLEKLVQTNPENTLKLANTSLKSASNANEKLIALYYSAQASNMLNQFSDTKDTVKKGLLLAQKQKSEHFIFEFTTFLVFEHELAGEFVEALKIANQNYQRALALDDDRLIAISLTVRGQMYFNLSDHQSALKDVKESLTIFQQNNDKTNISNSFNTLALIYTSLNDFEKSIEFYKESLNVYSEALYDDSTIYYNMGATYLELDNYTMALEYYNKAIDAATQVKDKYTVNFAKNGIADTYLNQDKYDDAIQLYLVTIKDFQKDDDIQMLLNVNLSLAQSYNGKGEFTAAINYLSKAKQYSQSLDSTLSNINVLRVEEQLFKSQSKWQDAYNSLELLTTSENELNQSNKENLIQELRVKYNAQFNQEKMKILQSNNKLKDDFIQQQQIKNNYLSIIIGLTAFLLLATLYAYGAQKKQRKHLIKLSTTDTLTKSYNRRFIVDYLKSLHLKQNNKVVAHSVIMVDLDYFKNINDTFGHETGNKVLIYFTEVVNQHAARHGKIGRLGGEEWLIILENFDASKVMQLLTVIRKDYRNNIPKNIPKDCELNFSCGVLLHAHLYQDYDQILKDVDKALYSAKHDGRGTDSIVYQKS